jgi:hypothetical protein
MIAEPQSRITAQQRHQVRLGIALSRDRQQPLVLVEVVKAHRLFRIGQQLDRARQPRKLAPFHGFLQQCAQHGQHVVHRLWRAICHRQLQPLDLFVGDRVETLRTERWNQVPFQNRFDRVNPARLVTVRSRVTVHKSRRERFFLMSEPTMLEGKWTTGNHFPQVDDGNDGPSGAITPVSTPHSVRQHAQTAWRERSIRGRGQDRGRGQKWWSLTPRSCV